MAPSVGLSQPWHFLLVRDLEVRTRIYESFKRIRKIEATRFRGALREHYLSPKLEGIVEAPLNLCVAVDLRTGNEHILGTTNAPQAKRDSVCCAIQNLWLAATHEGLAVEWVSLVDHELIRQELRLPESIEAVGYMRLGYAQTVYALPELEVRGWAKRDPIAKHMLSERWNE